MAEFQGVDFLRLDELLSDEERMARDTVREFVSREFLPLIQKHVRQDGSFPMELVPRMAELGLFGANLQGYGCAGMNNVAYGLVMQELERGDSGLRSFASVQGSLVMYPIHSYGSDAQKERWLPALAVGPRDRLLRADRARRRQPRLGHAHEGGAARRPLAPLRHQALDHERHARRRRRGVGRHRRRRARLPGREGAARGFEARDIKDPAPARPGRRRRPRSPSRSPGGGGRPLPAT